MLQRKTNNVLFFPGLVISGLSGGSGKTIFSVGIISALRSINLSVAPFKKGPDYIDAGWLALAAGRSCHNLDTVLMGKSIITQSYNKHSNFADISIVEGNRGLYDCINTLGKTSTAELSKLLKLKVILCVDVSKTTRTIAAILSGIISFDPEVEIGGIVLNRVAGLRHQRIVTKSIEYYCGLKILGAIPKESHEIFPERHMGLVPTVEHEWAKESIIFISDISKKYLDISAVLDLSGYSDINIKKQKVCKADSDGFFLPGRQESVCLSGKRRSFDFEGEFLKKPTIGVMRDSAFQFYYPENFEALECAGASIAFISPCNSEEFPEVDALYIGGGFPETHARQLENNVFIREKVRFFAEKGLPIYAECGGLIYLGEKFLVKNVSFFMSGVLPIIFKISKRPQGHGYTIVKVEKKNPYYSIGSVLIGHEFHYSSVYKWKGKEKNLIFSMKRGTGFINGKDGFLYKNVLATYTHIHALGVKEWAKNLVNKAREYMIKKSKV